MSNQTIYYYTDFNTFRLILQNGTLRFKESTSSNDNFDTVQLYNNLLDMANEKLDTLDLKAEQKFFFDMQKHNGTGSTRLSLVACFTSKADSRLLWDAYTMHRKDRPSERYNGLCIGFDKDKLLNNMFRNANGFDVKCCEKIIYGFENISDYLENYIDEYSIEVKRMSLEKDQHQDIIQPITLPFLSTAIVLKKCIVYPTLNLINKIDIAAPFFKHSFWHEEDETRALLSIKKNDKYAQNITRDSNGAAYFDLPISESCISSVILGPEFSVEDINVLNNISGKISFANLNTINSEGTGIITNR